jgi:hypothetical protein
VPGSPPPSFAGIEGRAAAIAELEERVVVLEKVVLGAVQDRINLLSPSDGCNLSEVIR